MAVMQRSQDLEPVIPPWPRSHVLRLALAGLGCCLLAGLLGIMDGGPGLLSTLRLLLAAAGILAASSTLTLRPTDATMWLLAAAAGWLAVFGLPGHWDSARLVASVAGSLAVAFGLLLLLPKVFRELAVTGLIVFHYCAILTATTWPDTHGAPAPFVTNQAAMRVYLPYFRFMYLGNAYHFYSPNPGPASHLFFLLEGETEEDADPIDGVLPRNEDGSVKRKLRSEWVDIPRRFAHYRDPLGMTYYRRLSITELVSYSPAAGVNLLDWERNTSMQNRKNNELGLTTSPQIFGAIRPTDMDLSQLRVPKFETRQFLHPSYARHIAVEYSGPRKLKSGAIVQFDVKRIKLFQVEHSIIGQADFIGFEPRPDDTTTEKAFHLSGIPRKDPFAPTLYLPFYLGEYDREGRLVKPEDPLLYWMTPIVPDPKDPKKFIDNMSRYAGAEFDWTIKE